MSIVLSIVFVFTFFCEESNGSHFNNKTDARFVILTLFYRTSKASELWPKICIELKRMRNMTKNAWITLYVEQMYGKKHKKWHHTLTLFFVMSFSLLISINIIVNDFDIIDGKYIMFESYVILLLNFFCRVSSGWSWLISHPSYRSFTILCDPSTNHSPLYIRLYVEKLFGKWSLVIVILLESILMFEIF